MEKKLIDERKLIEAIEANYQQIAEQYGAHLSSGNKQLDIKDVAMLHLYTSPGICTDMEFQQFIASALGDPQYRFSPEHVQMVQNLIGRLRQNGFAEKHPLVKLLKSKLPLVTSPMAPAVRIHHNVRFQMIAIKEAVEQDGELRRALERKSLEYALEHSPEHLFSMIMDMNADGGDSGELATKLHELRAGCLRTHHHMNKKK